jgi:UDP-N-acetylmuramoyl-tripeptide--D-alanyl-D-alanine ligase
MIRMSLVEAAQALNAAHGGGDAVFTGVTSDSRRVESGNLFVALRGEHFDGHGFAPQALQCGASALLLSRRVPVRAPYLEVDDTRVALGRLAAHWRARLGATVVAVTGSNGKTTVKEMIACTLARIGSVLATSGNLNNDIGVPLTLLRLDPSHRFAVIEMGANHAGEIAGLVGLSRPCVSVITNAAPAHLEGFGSIEGVARAKGEIFEGLPPQGTAVINADDRFAAFWKALAAPRRVITFGVRNGADVFALPPEEDDGDGSQTFRLHTPVGQSVVRLPLAGQHNVVNALAAAAVGCALEVPLESIKGGLESVRSVKGRLQLVRAYSGGRLIDDTYNANPASLESGLQALVRFPGRKLLVLGDMAELGPEARHWHAKAGQVARELGVTGLFAVGDLSRDAVTAFGDGADHFSDVDTLVVAILPLLSSETVVLVKGSRCMRMERVVDALMERPVEAAAAAGG